MDRGAAPSRQGVASIRSHDRPGTDPAVGRKTTKKATPAKGVASDLQHTAVDQRPTGSDRSVSGRIAPTGEGVVIRSWFQRSPSTFTWAAAPSRIASIRLWLT